VQQEIASIVIGCPFTSRPIRKARSPRHTTAIEEDTMARVLTPETVTVEGTELNAPTKPLGSYTQTIMRALLTMHRELCALNPDVQNNQGRYIGEAYLWRAVEKYASSCYDTLMTEDKKKKTKGELFINGILPDRDSLEEGSHDAIVTSPHFVVNVSVSKPVERFNPETLARKLSKEFKKPESYFLSMIEDAKKPTSGVVKWVIAERV
jgi:hypothetical protein